MAPAAVAAPSRGPSKLQKPTKVRYWKGKPTGAELDDQSDEDSDDADEGDQLAHQRGKQRALQAPVVKADADVVAGGAGRIFRPGAAAAVKVELAGVQVGKAIPVKKEEVESSEEETDDEEEEEEAKPALNVPKAPGSESSEYETDSEDESEEEKKPAFRPVFVKKDQRGMTQEKAQAMAEERQRQEEELRDQRKNDSKEIAGETIRRELAEKEATDIQPDVDDTDGLDPTADFESWRARELSRLLREKQAQAERDEEKEEIERRRAMPEEQRLREDMEFAEGTRNKEKTEMGFLQKYYHKGAFYSDDKLMQRDYTGATESAVDMSMLPKVMQVRDYGKASRTKYTHLADQDTSAGGWGNAARLPASMGMGASYSGANAGGIGTTQTGCWNCGGPHLRSACPNQNINDPMVQAGGMNFGGAANGSGGGYGGGSGSGNAYGQSSSTTAGAGGGARQQDSGYGQRRPADRSEGRNGRDVDQSGRSGYEGSSRYNDGRRDDPPRSRYDDPSGRRDARGYDERKRARSPDYDDGDRRRGERRDDYNRDRRAEDRYDRRDGGSGRDKGRERERERERDRDRDRDRRDRR